MRGRWRSAAVWLERGQQLDISNQECPPRSPTSERSGGISMVMIGIDPHKRTHTAVAVDGREVVIAERLVHARAGQVTELVAWADALGDRERIWAIESAGGLGYLLSQQLLAAGEAALTFPR